MMWRVWIMLAASLALWGCATDQDPAAIAVQTVSVPVAVNCAAPAPPKPELADTGAALIAAPDLYRRVQLLMAGRLQRDAYIAALEASRAGCR